jgi:hypothetical protein
LAAINNPSYFLIEGPLFNNSMTLADMSEASASGSNQTITTTTSSLPGNQSLIVEGAGSANTTSGGGGIGTDDPGSESDNPFSDST